MKTAVLIPCYNEEITIEKVIKDFKKELPDAEIYVYNNNSKDKTAEIAEKNGAIVRHEYRQGKGNVVRSMFREIDADIYVMVDGDDTYPAEEVHKLIKPVVDGEADMVIGDRLTNGTYQKENKRHFHEFGNNLVKKSINVAFKTDLKDIMTGYRVFNKLFVKTMPVMSPKFEIETEMTIHTLDKNMGVENVIIEYRDRPEGSVSKLSTYSDGFKVLKTIASLYKNYRPLSFFSWVSLALALVGLVFLIPVLIDYAKTGLVPKMPSFVASIFFFICSIQSFFGGLTLQTLVKKSRQDFEIKLNEYADRKRRLLNRK